MNRIRQSEGYPTQADVCGEWGSSFELDSAHFSPARSDFPRAIFAPLHYEPNYAYPLLVWLHGPGSDQNQLLRIMPIISMRNYVAVAPQGILTQPEETYRWLQTLQHIEQAEERIFDGIESVTEKYNFSPDKIFLAGFDSGGTMALRVAMNNPRRFAGVISLCGRFPRGHHPFGNLAAARGMPVLLTAGRTSKIYEESDVCADLRLLHSAGFCVSLRQYPCGQQITPQMLGDVDRWIIERITSPSSVFEQSDANH